MKVVFKNFVRRVCLPPIFFIFIIAFTFIFLEIPVHASTLFDKAQKFEEAGNLQQALKYYLMDADATRNLEAAKRAAVLLHKFGRDNEAIALARKFSTARDTLEETAIAENNLTFLKKLDNTIGLSEAGRQALKQLEIEEEHREVIKNLKGVEKLWRKRNFLDTIAILTKEAKNAKFENNSEILHEALVVNFVLLNFWDNVLNEKENVRDENFLKMLDMVQELYDGHSKFQPKKFFELAEKLEWSMPVRWLTNYVIKLLFSKGDLDNLIELLNASLKTSYTPILQKSLLNLAILYHKLGDDAKAAQYFYQITPELLPEDSIAVYNKMKKMFPQ